MNNSLYDKLQNPALSHDEIIELVNNIEDVKELLHVSDYLLQRLSTIQTELGLNTLSEVLNSKKFKLPAEFYLLVMHEALKQEVNIQTVFPEILKTMLLNTQNSMNIREDLELMTQHKSVPVLSISGLSGVIDNCDVAGINYMKNLYNHYMKIALKDYLAESLSTKKETIKKAKI